MWQTVRPPSRQLSRPPAAICAKPARRPRKVWLSREPAEKNHRLSRQEKCGLITEKSIIAVFNICKLFTTAICTAPCRRSYVFFVFTYKMHLLSLHFSDNKTHPWLNIIIINQGGISFPQFTRSYGQKSLNLIGQVPNRSVYHRKETLYD